MGKSAGKLFPIVRFEVFLDKFGIRVPRDTGREYRRSGCGSSLGIFNFLLFLVYLLALIQDVMIDVVTNIMINGQSVTTFQANTSQNSMFTAQGGTLVFIPEMESTFVKADYRSLLFNVTS